MKNATYSLGAIQLTQEPLPPLPSLAKENIFKLFLFDIDPLRFMLDLTYKEHKDQGFNYKGYLAENFIQNELIGFGPFQHNYINWQ